MSKEIPSASEILDIKTLSPQSKMKYILSIFELGKDDKNEERKKKFIELLAKYHRTYIKSVMNLSTKKDREAYEEGRADLHNQIMEIITKMSLSLGLSTEQREVVSYLAENRDEVTRMISSYFLGHDTSNPQEYSGYQAAHKGEGWFRSVPGKEDE